MTSYHLGDDYEWALESTNATTNVSLPKEEVRFGIYKVGYAIVLAIGFIGNSLNLAVMWHSHRLRKLSYFFLRWLAVTDFLVIVALLMFNLVKTKAIHRTYSVMWYYSHINFFLTRSLACASALIITAFTISRYASICHPTRCKTLSLNPKVYSIVLIAVFTLSCFLHIPHLFETHVVRITDSETNATIEYDWEWNDLILDVWFFANFYPVIKELISKLLPIIAVFTLNLCIIRAHHEYVKKRNSMRNLVYREDRKKVRDEGRLMVLLLSASTVFFVCTLPQAFVTVLLRSCTSLYDTSVTFFVFVHVANLIDTVQFAANFYVYSLASLDFRRSFREVFCLCAKKQKNDELLSTNSMASVAQNATSSRKKLNTECKRTVFY